MIEPREVNDWITSGPERRVHARRPFSCTAYLRLPTQQVLEVHTVDLSSGGIGIVSPVNTPPGWLCDISFNVTREPSGVDHVMAQGRVAYSVLSGREYGFLIGLQFVNLAPEHREIIEKHFQSAGMGWSHEKG